MGIDGGESPANEAPYDITRWFVSVSYLSVVNPEIHNRLLEMVEAAAAGARRAAEPSSGTC